MPVRAALTVPAVSALQQKAAEANPFAVAGRERTSPCASSSRAKIAGNFPRTDVRRSCRSVIDRRSDRGEPERRAEQSTVAQVAGRPAAPTRTHPDMMSVVPCVADGCDNSSVSRACKRFLGKAFRQKAIPAPFLRRAASYPSAPRTEGPFGWKVKSLMLPMTFVASAALTGMPSRRCGSTTAADR